MADAVLEALGAGWERQSEWRWGRGRRMWIDAYNDGTRWCVWMDGTVYDGPTAARAVAIARLLTVAEEVAAGGPIRRLCGDDCATEREMAYALGRDEERARVVAYLRDQAGTARANTIARAEHWAGHECGPPPVPHLAGGDDDRPEWRDA